MLSHEQLSGYFEAALSGAERTQVEALLESDPAARQQLAEQRCLDQALRVLLGSQTANEHIKQSVLAVIHGASMAQLRARVLEDTSAAPPSAGAKSARQGSRLVGWAGTAWLAGEQWAAQAWNWVRVLGATPPRRLALAAVSAAMVLAGILLWPGVSPRPVEIGKFTVVVGAPNVQRARTRAAHQASPSAPVCSGDRIVTGDADKAEIQFHDGTTLRLSFNTTIQIPSLKSKAQSARPAGRPAEINLLGGHLWAKVQKTTNQTRFAVNTPVATAVVKGTEFGLKLQRGASLTNLVPRPSPLASSMVAVLTVREGAVEFSNPFGKVEATDLTESVATGDAAPTPPKRVTTLKVFRVAPLNVRVRTTTRPSFPDAGYRLVYRTGWAGLDVADIAVGSQTQAVTAAAAPEQARVVRVQRSSPAEKAGLRVGETILALDGRPITNAWEVSAAISERVGRFVTLTLGGEPAPRTVSLTTTIAPDAPPLPSLARSMARALEAASRLLLERRTDDGERALGQLIPGQASAAAHSDLGLLYETRDDLSQALVHYQKALEAAPQVALYHFNYALALQNIGNLERAAEEAAIATSLAPSWAEAFQLLSEVCSQLGRGEEALRAVDDALRSHPASPDVWLSRGSVLEEQNRNDEAQQAYLKALELEPDYAEACRELGDLYHHEDRLDEAERLLRRAIEINPSDAGAFNILGNIYIAQGRYPEAERALREAIRLDPTGALAYSNLGYLFRRRGQPDEAEKLYRKAIELAPDSPVGFSNLGELLRRAGRLDEAERMLRTAIELDPQGAAAMNNLGGLYLYNRRQPDQAEKIFQRAIQVDPTFPAPYNNLGNLMLDRGNLGEAENLYRKAIDLIGDKPESVITWLSLGKLYEKRGDTAGAIQAYRKALALQPGLPEARAALQRLGGN